MGQSRESLDPTPSTASSPAQGRVGIGRLLLFGVFIVGLIFLFLVRSILPPFVAAVAIAYFASPIVTWIQGRLRLRRTAAAAAFYAMTLLPLLLAGWALEPAFVRETRELGTNAPHIVTDLLVQLFGGQEIRLLGQRMDVETVSGYLVNSLTRAVDSPAEAIHVATVAVQTVLSFFLTAVLTFYFLVDGGRLADAGLALAPPAQRERLRAAADEINMVLSRYVRGLLFLVVLMATATWLGLSLVFRLPYALPVAIATGLLEVIPFVGPIAAGALAAIIAFSHAGVGLAVGVIAFYFVLRQAEDQLVMPAILGRAVALHPAVIIFAVMAGGTIAGVLGTLLAIPAAATIKVALDHWYAARTGRSPEG